MTEQEKGAGDPAQDAAVRLDEIRRLTDDIKNLLRDRIADWRDQADLNPAEINKRIGDLHSAHLKLVEQERIFHAKLGLDTEKDAIDFDAIRADIGRALDRIRAKRGAGGVSGGTD